MGYEAVWGFSSSPTQDQYGISWHNDGEAVPDGGVTNPTLNVYQLDGTQIITDAVPAPVAATGVLLHVEATNRLVAENQYILVAKATIDAAVRTHRVLITNAEAGAGITEVTAAVQADGDVTRLQGGSGPWTSADISALALEASVQALATLGGPGPWTTADLTGVALEASVQAVLAAGGPGPWTTADLTAVALEATLAAVGADVASIKAHRDRVARGVDLAAYPFVMFGVDGQPLADGATVTVQVMKDGGAWAAATNAPVGKTNGAWAIDLVGASDLDGVNHLFLATADGALPSFFAITVQDAIA